MFIIREVTKNGRPKAILEILDYNGNIIKTYSYFEDKAEAALFWSVNKDTLV